MDILRLDAVAHPILTFWQRAWYVAAYTAYDFGTVPLALPLLPRSHRVNYAGW